MKVEVYKGKDGDWYWHLLAANGLVIGTSGEGYKSKWRCKQMAKRLFRPIVVS